MVNSRDAGNNDLDRKRLAAALRWIVSSQLREYSGFQLRGLLANPACGIQVMNHLGSRHTRQDIQSQAMAEPILSDTVLMDMICLHPKRMNTEEASVAP